MDSKHAGTGYLTVPDSGTGPGILVLHAWWGLTPFFKTVCDRLAAAGFVALAPDLLGGQVADTVEQAERQLAEADADQIAHVTASGLHHLRQLSITPAGPMGVLGFSMGASMALWLSAREPEGVAATAVFYGTQDIDFAGSRSAYLGHFAETDPWVEEDQLVLLEADLHLLDLNPTIHRYPGTQHWFFEEDRPEHHPEASALAWERTLEFFRERLPAPGEG